MPVRLVPGPHDQHPPQQCGEKAGVLKSVSQLPALHHAFLLSPVGASEHDSTQEALVGAGQFDSINS